MNWLVSLKKSPPGEFYYKQNGKTFGPGPLIGEVAGALSAFRQSNKLPNADLSASLLDIILFTVERLGPTSEYVFNTEATAAELLPSTSGGGCGGCGIPIK